MVWELNFNLDDDTLINVTFGNKKDDTNLIVINEIKTIINQILSGEKVEFKRFIFRKIFHLRNLKITLFFASYEHLDIKQIIEKQIIPKFELFFENTIDSILVPFIDFKHRSHPSLKNNEMVFIIPLFISYNNQSFVDELMKLNSKNMLDTLLKNSLLLN